MVAKMSRVGFWFAIFLVVLAVGLVSRWSEPHFSLLSTVTSPDGLNDAVLMEDPRDAHGNEGFRVCLRRHSLGTPTVATCAGIVYLSASIPASPAVHVTLAWTGAQQLEVRYSGSPNISSVRTPFNLQSGLRPRLSLNSLRYHPIST